MSKYSIIIPYQHLEERLPLFYTCLNNLIKVSKGRFEICIHETGESKVLQIPNGCKYLFTKYSGVFHRAWAINRCVKRLATGDMLVLMDGDLIVDSKWTDTVLSCTEPLVGWGRIFWLTKEATNQYLNDGTLDKEQRDKTRSPSMGSAAGAITIIPRDVFFQTKGVPEDFTGSWGGEDNAFWAKLRCLGYEFGSIKAEVYHLHHSRSTPRVRDIQVKAHTMFHWRRKQWQEYIKVLDCNWGMPDLTSYITPSIEYISTIETPRITFAMLSWLRYDKLTETLKDLKETLTIPANVIVMVQGSERLNLGQRRRIRHIVNRFAGSEVYFTKGNMGTARARKGLLKRALNRFHSPYLNLSDDDTTFSNGSIEAAIELLDKDLSIGVVGIRFKPKVHSLNNHINPLDFIGREAKQSIEYVDYTGSASAIIRRDVFDLCKIDPTYILGQWDLDLFVQARAVGWKIVNFEGFPGMKASNNWGGCNEYKRARLNRHEIRKSISYFKQRWGIRKAA